jgi:hypothetical protein
MTWFIVPESLPLQQMELLRQKHTAEADERVRSMARRVFAFLSPLGLLMPEVRGKEQGNGNPLKSKGRDWTLTLVAAAYGLTTALTVRILQALWAKRDDTNAAAISREVICIPSSIQLPCSAGLRKRCVFYVSLECGRFRQRLCS